MGPPVEWEIARLSATFKTGERSELKNSMPISIAPVMPKLFSTALYFRIQSVTALYFRIQSFVEYRLQEEQL
eukprot:9413785-Pyramimonas_sp.AAC.1